MDVVSDPMALGQIFINKKSHRSSTSILMLKYFIEIFPLDIS